MVFLKTITINLLKFIEWLVIIFVVFLISFYGTTLIQSMVVPLDYP